MKESMKLFYPLLLLPLLAGCPFAKCGDNSQDETEACDDGNNIDADGCEADCSLPACNNGIQDPGELCFAAPQTFNTDTSPIEPATADFNGDGHQDIITANSTGESVSVLLGDGTGNFARQTDVELSSPVLFLAAGLFDDDPSSDFAASLPDVNLIQVLVGQGDGVFGVRDALSAPNPSQLTTADFDNDGIQDIIASSSDGIALFLNDGTGAGTFEAPRISFIGSNPVIAAADFDGDSNIDVAAGVGGNLILLLGDGVGNLAPQAAQLTGAIQGRITAADFNGDQLPDPILTSNSNNQVVFFLSQP
jgi:cysteine-rich repeat protein